MSQPTIAFKPEKPPELFEPVKAKFPASLGPEKWFVVVATSAFVLMLGIFAAGTAYVYLTEQPEYASIPHGSELDKRLRDFLVKTELNTGTTKVIAFSDTIKADQHTERKSTNYVAKIIST